MQFRDSVYPPGACKGGSGGCLTDNLYYNHFLSRVLKHHGEKLSCPGGASHVTGASAALRWLQLVRYWQHFLLAGWWD